MKKNKIFSVWMAILLTMAMLAGCASQDTPTENTNTTDGDGSMSNRAGSLLVCVNPEIEVVYDREGLVVSLEGRNEDGKAVLADFTDYTGEPCTDVVNRLVDKIHENGYFNETVDGREKNIVIKIGENSVYPSDDFMDDIAQGVQETVNEFGGTAKAIAVEEDDLDDRGYINETTAKELAMAQAGVADAEFAVREYDLDDGIYELEFVLDGVTYELEVDARTGKVLEADLEHNDDWNDDDNDDDDNDNDDNDNDDDNMITIPVDSDDDDQSDDGDDQDDDGDDQDDDGDDQNDDSDDQNDDSDDQNDDGDDQNDDGDDQDDDGDDQNDDSDDQNDDGDDQNDDSDDQNDDSDDQDDDNDDTVTVAPPSSDDSDDGDNDDWDDDSDDDDSDGDDSDDDDD